MSTDPAALEIRCLDRSDDLVVLTISGILDSRTYLQVRTAIVKAAVDQPWAVVIDVSGLHAPAESAWSVLTAAHWMTNTWPAIPLAIISTNGSQRNALRRNGIHRYLPIYPNHASALAAVADSAASLWVRRRGLVDLPHAERSVSRARAALREWLTAWQRTDFQPYADVVVTELVENVLHHTASRPRIRAELCRGQLIITVTDDNPLPAVRREYTDGSRMNGLTMVAALSRRWGTAPTISGGKVVWALLDPAEP